MRLKVSPTPGGDFKPSLGRWLRLISDIVTSAAAPWRRMTLCAVAPFALATMVESTRLVNFDALSAETTVDRLVLDKSERRLVAYRRGEVLKTYSVALGRQPVGAKRFEGDGKTPEGVYWINGRNPESQYHRSLSLSYPRPADVKRAKRHRRSPGGDIMIHGTPEGYGYPEWMKQSYDWTQGCIAVTNEDIEELWRIVPDGTPIEIRP